ncbi:MAG TPA: FAD-dependent oxidoreductase [bacterium]|jgi:sarcosine oxidase subunit beta
MPPVPSTAKIVIIGGGVVGLFTAWELASRGEKDIVIIERRTFLGSGSTQKAAGGFRTQFTTPSNVAFSKYSKQYFLERFPQELNPHFEIEQHGYLLFARNQEKLERLEHSYQLQMELGVENVHKVDADFIKNLIPELETSEILGGNYSPEDGWLDPSDVVNGLDTGVRKHGIAIFTDTEVTDIDTIGDHNFVVKTSDGDISARHVLVATGAWSRELTGKLGIELHMHPMRHTLWCTAPLDWYPKTAPFTFDVMTTAHFRPESGGLMMGHSNPNETSSTSEDADMDFFLEIIPNFLEIIPRLEEAEVANAWGGLYEESEDHNGIMGPLPGPKGLWIATGFSGHGVMHAPATGCVMAEFILDGKTSTLDASPYCLERFDKGELIRETNVF